MANKLEIPVSNGVPLSDTPAIIALASTYDATVSASTELVLNVATQLIEVTALDKAIFLAWGVDDASTSNFDEVIPANATRQFVVPGGITAVNFLETAATALLCVVEKG